MHDVWVVIRIWLLEGEYVIVRYFLRLENTMARIARDFVKIVFEGVKGIVRALLRRWGG